MVPSTRDPPRLNKIHQGRGHLVGGVHPGGDAGRQAHVPRHLHHEPARPHRRGDWPAACRRRGVDPLALRRQHARVPPGLQAQVPVGHVPVGVGGRAGSAAQVPKVQPIQAHHRRRGAVPPLRSAVPQRGRGGGVPHAADQDRAGRQHQVQRDGVPRPPLQGDRPQEEGDPPPPPLKRDTARATAGSDGSRGGPRAAGALRFRVGCLWLGECPAVTARLSMGGCLARAIRARPPARGLAMCRMAAVWMRGISFPLRSGGAADGWSSALPPCHTRKGRLSGPRWPHPAAEGCGDAGVLLEVQQQGAV
mmetsp:Transcript_7936/g.16920  ORF Transcript_7936/g.16920 Transcript_7936/m.16920 type:complete len:306 (-) Transcript_7936:51-968(-)